MFLTQQFFNYAFNQGTIPKWGVCKLVLACVLGNWLDLNQSKMFDFTSLYIEYENISFLYGRLHCPWGAAKFRVIRAATVFWEGRDLYRAIRCNDTGPRFTRSRPKERLF